MMRQIATVFAIALSFFLFASCSTSKETSKTQVTAEDVKRETQKAARTAESYAQQQKEEYERKAEAEIKELDRRIGDLKAQAKKTAKSKAAIDKQIAELRKQQEIARQKLEELKAASASTWEETKKKVVTAIDELKRAYDRAASRLKS